MFDLCSIYVRRQGNSYSKLYMIPLQNSVVEIQFFSEKKYEIVAVNKQKGIYLMSKFEYKLYIM